MPRRRSRSAETLEVNIPVSDPNLRETVVMFVDIIGASEVSNHKGPQEYANFVKDFQNLFLSVCEQHVKGLYAEQDRKSIKYETRGDEGLLLIYPPRPRVDVSTDVDLVINIALALKRRWLCSKENNARIKDWGLLPIDLAIGIHTGMTYLIDNSPEGYTINLAKRIEGESRQGRFSHIFLSESAHGHLNNLPDETTYLFDDPQQISTKGISRDIRVYEVKHHFLPSDWQEESSPQRRSKTLLMPPKKPDIETIEAAVATNPTNLWLAEEFIRASMLYQYYELPERNRDNDECLREAFGPAQQRADVLRQGSQRDAGILFIHGLVLGQYGDYEGERQNYSDAIFYSDQLAQAYYYRGLSYSYDLADKIKGDLSKTYDQLTPEQQSLASSAIDDLRQARRRRPQCAWMLYDYGCELIRWARSDTEKNEGFDNIELAVSRLGAVREKIPDQDYLQTVLKHPSIRKLLSAD